MASPEEVLTFIQEVAERELELGRRVEASDALLLDLSLDSMGLTVLAVALEDRFRLKLSESDSTGVRTVGELAELVSRRTREAA